MVQLVSFGQKHGKTGHRHKTRLSGLGHMHASHLQVTDLLCPPAPSPFRRPLCNHPSGVVSQSNSRSGTHHQINASTLQAMFTPGRRVVGCIPCRLTPTDEIRICTEVDRLRVRGRCRCAHSTVFLCVVARCVHSAVVKCRLRLRWRSLTSSCVLPSQTRESR